MQFKNLQIIGTSHIAKQSMKEVKEAYESIKPDMVAVELDKRRLYALLNKKKTRGPGIKEIRKIGIKGYLFSLLGAWAGNKLGNSVGVSPGSDMMTAIKLAKKDKIPIALIDQDIEITLKRFSKELTWKEKWNFIVDIFNGFVLRKKEKIDFNLSEVPEKQIIDKLITRVKKRYPSIYKVLIEERNHVMAKNFAALLAKEPDKKILGVIGAGHEEEMVKLIGHYSKIIAKTSIFPK